MYVCVCVCVCIVWRGSWEVFSATCGLTVLDLWEIEYLIVLLAEIMFCFLVDNLCKMNIHIFLFSFFSLSPSLSSSMYLFLLFFLPCLSFTICFSCFFILLHFIFFFTLFYCAIIFSCFFCFSFNDSLFLCHSFTL